MDTSVKQNTVEQEQPKRKRRVFDTTVQLLKYKTLREVIKAIDKGETSTMYMDIPPKIAKGPKAKMRCCIYKERAILQERIKLAMGGDKSNPNIIEVIDIACDECPIDGIMVTEACRGCIVHNCQEVCPKDAISIINKRAVIDKSKCIECGKCAKACPYNAILQRRRPCVRSCKVNAISMDENFKARIDNNKCIACGACVYQCPFGAIIDKSMISEIIEMLKGSNNGENYNVYAVIAPAIVSQFKYAKIEQVVTGIKNLGFCDVVEAALGADIDLHLEAMEFAEKGLVLTSCCPSFVMYVEKNFPQLAQYLSHTVSPMVQSAKLIKNSDPTAKVVFIGPCSSKKMEYKLPKTGGAIDLVMSFEELQAFFDARDVDVENLPHTELDNASYFGRIFARSGGIAVGAKKTADDMGVYNLNPISMNGIEECKLNLMKLKMGKAVHNFFEGMACEGGCINGALCLSHGPKNALEVDRYGATAKEKTIKNSINLYNLSK